MSLRLGCIADDLTGASDLALQLFERGIDVIELLDQPDETTGADAEAAVVALKTRTCPPDEAVRASLAAVDWLLQRGAAQILLKYCSTFDSTDEGNIGPVAAALLERLDEELAIVCPAFPSNRRTIYRGHLFVGDRLLSESGMADHPLTPMRDSDLVRVLGRQLGGQTVGSVPYEVVAEGRGPIRAELERLAADGTRFAVVDALSDAHLLEIGAACHDHRLVTGGSAIAMGLAENLKRSTESRTERRRHSLPRLDGPVAILSGSCSRATREQEERAQGVVRLVLDPVEIAEDPGALGRLLESARRELERGVVLVSSAAPPDSVRAAQSRLGAERAGELVESALAELAQGLVGAGVRKLIVAGGETSGAVARSLGIRRVRVGAGIAPGVPWSVTLDDPELLVAFKSGNFGGADFFDRALEALP